MKIILATVMVLVSIYPAIAYYEGPQIRWDGWRASSAATIEKERFLLRYPLTYLFDANPKTAWVCSNSKIVDRQPPAIEIRSQTSKGVWVDSLWIMNGYNRSSRLFHRNNRVTKLKLFVNDMSLKTVSLTDAMGWHKIAIPRQRLRSIMVEFIEFEKGRDDDTCISELALYDREQKIDMKMPQAVVFVEAEECCCCRTPATVITRTGKVLATNDPECGPDWSPTGKRISGISCSKNYCHLWVIDSTKARIIYSKRFPFSSDPIPYWKDDNTISLHFAKEGVKPKRIKLPK